MAERRMFSKTVIDSDMFLDMPLSSQLLYFHLAMRADDDGFIGNPRKIQRMIGATDDDARLLIAKKFIIPFESSGVIVIRHWKIHNYIQNDRYHPTIYTFEKKQLSIDENKIYSLPNQDVLLPENPCIQNVYSMDTEDSIGKERQDKDSIDKVNINEFERFWELYPRKSDKEYTKKCFDEYVDVSIDVIINAIETQTKSEQWQKDNGKFIPSSANWLKKKRWNDTLPTKNKSFDNYELPDSIRKIL